MGKENLHGVPKGKGRSQNVRTSYGQAVSLDLGNLRTPLVEQIRAREAGTDLKAPKSTNAKKS